ncbi:MAG: FAD-binding oxidoreductase, partial [Planctomycetota bacterium]|nr:FAD-binding oxidoreductase [Planctomycetota bacterium]
MSSPWLTDPISPRESLQGEQRCSIIILGGGLVGVAAAYFLSREGCDVALVEKGSLGTGATGRSTGFLLS